MSAKTPQQSSKQQQQQQQQQQQDEIERLTLEVERLAGGTGELEDECARVSRDAAAARAELAAATTANASEMQRLQLELARLEGAAAEQQAAAEAARREVREARAALAKVTAQETADREEVARLEAEHERLLAVELEEAAALRAAQAEEAAARAALAAVLGGHSAEHVARVSATSAAARGAVTLKGGCHCRRVLFAVDVPSPVLQVVICNCSICNMKRNAHFIVPEKAFRLLAGEADLTTYRFNTKQAAHTFCSTCGVQAFYTPRSNPDGRGITVYCLDAVSGMGDAAAEPSVSVVYETFDGENWEICMASKPDFHLRSQPPNPP